MVHHWRRPFLAVCLAANGYLKPSAPRTSLIIHTCSQHDEWRTLCTGYQSSINSVFSVDSPEGKEYPQQRKTIQECASHCLSGSAQNLVLNKAAASFLDLGFSNAQVIQLLVLNQAGGVGFEESLTIVSELLLLGLNPGSILKILQNYPDVQRVTVKQLKDRAEYLRRLGLGEGSLQQVIAHFPCVLMVSRKHADAVVRCLKERCLFSAQQLAEIVRTCPGILKEQPDELEYKFQYAHFRLGVQQQEVVKSRLFGFSLSELKYRHSFLERLGRYQTPDKKGQTQICNPKLKELINVSEDLFLSKVALSNPEEFHVFKKLLNREEAEKMEEEEDGENGRLD
ncbi:transcription termination factor 4, mitochondrial isoform X2 [Lissotriton helveticus]